MDLRRIEVEEFSPVFELDNYTAHYTANVNEKTDDLAAILDFFRWSDHHHVADFKSRHRGGLPGW